MNKKILRKLSCFLSVTMLSSVFTAMPSSAATTEKLSFSDVEILDASGNSLDAISGIDSYRTKVTFDAVESNVSADLYAAAYTAGGKLTNISKEAVELTANTLKQSYTLEMDNNGGEYIKVFAWDKNQQPLTESYSTNTVQNLVIEGNPVLYDTLQAKFDYTGDRSGFTYKWYMANGRDSTYSEVTDTCTNEAGKIRLLQNTDYFEQEMTVNNTSTSDQNTITVTLAAGMNPSYSGKWLKLEVTDNNGKVYKSTPVQIKDTYYTELYNGQEVTNARDTSDPEYVFEVDGKKFILLDAFDNDDDGKYLVAALEDYGNRAYFLTDQGQKPFEMINWLNTTFKTEGSGECKLPQDIIDNIDYDRYWQFEQGAWWHVAGSFNNGDGKTYRYLSAKGGIMLPAFKDLEAYANKWGLHDTNANYWLRSPVATASNGGAQADGNWMARITEKGTAIAGTHGRMGGAHAIKPMFALNKDFFRNVKIDVAGSKVFEQIAKDVSYQDLKVLGYTDAEIRSNILGIEDIQNVYMDGIFEYYQTINGVVEAAEGADVTNVDGAWLYSDSEAGTYSVIPESEYVTDTAITLVQGADEVIDNPNLPGAILLKGNKQTYAGKWLKYRATVDGVTRESEPRKILESWGGEGEYTTLSADASYVANTPDDYKFSVDGQEFILLNTTESSKSHYYILANDVYTSTQQGSSQEMEGMAAWLNSEFKDAGYLPDSILSEIDYEHYWKVAPRYWLRDTSGLWHRAVKGGIGLLGRREYIAYHDKIGFGAETDWWLYDPATAHGTTDGGAVLCINSLTGDISWKAMQHSALGIRPSFYVGEDFFEKVTITDAGEAVINQLIEDVGEDKLKEMYGINYKDIMASNPDAEKYVNISLDGVAEYYQTLEGKLSTNETIESFDGAWLYSDSETGTYSVIPESEYVTDTSITLVQGADAVVDNIDNPGSFYLKGMNYTYSGKWIKYQATLNGDVYETEPVKITDKWQDEAYYTSLTADNTYVSGTPDGYKFTVGNDDFILLDTVDTSSKSHYYILADKSYTTAGKGASQYMDVMAAWLNNGFKNGDYLPAEILAEIDYDRYWQVAPRYWLRNETGRWKAAVKGGIGLLSRQEYIEHHEKIGYAAADKWWLYDPATAHGRENGEYLLYVDGTNGNVAYASMQAALGIRPAFYVSEDFFKNVKITGAGEEVMKQVLADYTADELIALYGESYRSQMSGSKVEPIVPVMEGIFDYYHTVNGSVIENDLYDEYDMTTAEYSWLYASVENGSYTEIPKDGTYVTDDSITIVLGETVEDNANMPGTMLLLQNNMTLANKWLKYAVTVGGETFTSEPQQIGDNWAGEEWYKAVPADETYVAESPAENVFTAGGQEFILLDTTMSNNSHYLVLAKEQYMQGKEGSAQRMESWAMWMEDTFKNGGYLPEEIVNNINYEHYWKVAPEYWGRSNNNLWIPAVKSGIYFLGTQNYLKYHEKIGYADGNTTSWWLGDPAIGINNDGNLITCVTADGSVSGGNRTTQSLGVRPAFYLNKDFFKNVKVSDVGANVLEQIKKDVTEAELIALYGDNYLDAMGETKYDVYLKGIFETGEKLTVASDSIELSGAEYAWMISTKKLMGYTELTGENAASYTTTDALAGYYIRAKVTVDGVSYESKPEKIGALWNIRQANSTIAAVDQHSPAEYSFSVGGDQYILLDTTTSDSSKYLIMAKNSVANRKYTENGYESQVFSLNANTLGNWLNDGYFNSLPVEVQKSINLGQNWKIDIAMWVGETESSVQAGIVVPAVNELKKYKDRIGFDEDMGDRWWTRTPLGVRGGDGNHVMTVNYTDGEVNLISAHSTTYAGVRPMFYADKDFFNEVKVSSAGSEVLKNIQKTALYTDEEWNALNAQAKEGITFNIPSEISSGSGDINVTFDIERDSAAVYTIEAKCNEKEQIPTTMSYNGEVNETVAVEFGSIPNGINTITVTVKRDGAVIAEQAKEVTVYAPYVANANQAATLTGFCSYIGSTGSEMLEKSLNTGMQINRINMPWASIEDGQDGRGKGEYDWFEMDNVMLPLLENGIEPLVLLAYSNPLYDNFEWTYASSVSPAGGLYTKELIDAFAAYAKAIAQHYLDMGYELKYFEFWNEPNAKTTFPAALGHKYFSDACAVMAHEVKSVLPDATIISGALAHAAPAWMKDIVGKGYYSADGFSYHPYVSHYTYKYEIDDTDLTTTMNDMNLVNLGYGGWKENWISEFGTTTWNHTDYGFTEEEQASELVKEAVIANATYTDANIYYCYRNTGNVESDYEHNFGVVEYNGNIKLAYISTSAMMQNLAGAVYLGKVDGAIFGNADVKLYMYQRDGEIIGVMWNTNDSDATLSFNGCSLTAYDMYNNLISENISSVTVNKEPVYIYGFSNMWANIALSSAIAERINMNCEYIGADASVFNSVLAISSEISEKTGTVNTDAYIETVASLIDTIIANGSYTEVQKSALLYTLHQVIAILAVGGTLNTVDNVTADAQERYDDVMTMMEEKESAVIGGKLLHSDAMLNVANKYIDFVEKIEASDVNSGYKNSMIKAYNLIADKAIDMAEAFVEIETVSNKNLLVQMPLIQADLEALTASYAKAGDFNISVYNYGDIDLTDVTMEIQNSKGASFTDGTVTFSCPAGESVEVNVPHKAQAYANLTTNGNGYYADFVIKSAGTEIYRTTLPLDSNVRDGIFMD